MGALSFPERTVAISETFIRKRTPSPPHTHTHIDEWRDFTAVSVIRKKTVFLPRNVFRITSVRSVRSTLRSASPNECCLRDGFMSSLWTEFRCTMQIRTILRSYFRLGLTSTEAARWTLKDTIEYYIKLKYIYIYLFYLKIKLDVFRDNGYNK